MTGRKPGRRSRSQEKGAILIRDRLRVGIALHRRKNIARLSDQQLATLRSAFTKVMAIRGRDERGYNHHAGIHGLPLPVYCQHGSRLFLPWHRAYLYFFELALQDQEPTVSIPWWNWSSAQSRTEGIPGAYADESVDGDANPLFSAEIPPEAQDNGRFPRTFRTPRPPARLPTRQDVRAVLEAGDFLDFSNRLEIIHNGIHVWVGGTMSFVPWAAYDPLFWAHHSMVDRIWRLWQLRHPGSVLDPDLQQEVLVPFGITVGEVLDVTELGYDYAGTTRFARRASG